VLEYQALVELGDTEGDRNWAIGGWRVGRFIGFVYGDNGSRFPARGKGVEDQGQLKMKRRCC